jgi:excisionase family DNA binding protein
MGQQKKPAGDAAAKPRRRRKKAPEPAITFSVREAARILNIGKTTLYRKIEAGELEREPDGKISEPELRRFLEDARARARAGGGFHSGEDRARAAAALRQEFEDVIPSGGAGNLTGRKVYGDAPAELEIPPIHAARGARAARVEPPAEPRGPSAQAETLDETLDNLPEGFDRRVQVGGPGDQVDPAGLERSVHDFRQGAQAADQGLPSLEPDADPDDERRQAIDGAIEDDQSARYV